MAPVKLTDREAPAVITSNATVSQRTASRLPPILRFPVLLALTFFIRAALWSLTTEYLPQELGVHSKVEEHVYSVVAHLAYRVVLLWFTWKANYDWLDVGALTVLTTVPYLFLLSTYYEVSTLTIAAFANIEVVSIAFPTLLLRPRSAVHNPRVSLRNRFLLESFQVQSSTALLAIGVYVTVFWIAERSGLLNAFLVTHFEIPTLEAAHSETPLSLVAKVATAGWAARTFLLNPSIGAQAASGSATPVELFDPATADLPKTLKHNFWFFDRRTRTLITQTTVLIFFLFANTVQRAYTLKGTDFVGALGYAGIWSLANVIIAGWWVWVGDTDEPKEE